MHLFADRTWLWLAASLYVAGFILGTYFVLRERRHLRGSMYATIAAGFVLQTIGLYLRGLEVRGCPIGNQFEIFQFTGWSATALYLLIGARFRLSLLGYFTCCLAAVLTLVSLSVPGWDAVRRVNAFGGNSWIEFHAALALFSYGVFALLALTSVMYLLQLYSLQRHDLRRFFSFLPSIVELDHISVRLLTMGVLLMSASLAVGSVYWLRDTTTVQGSKLVTTVAVWLGYTLTLALRARGLLIAKRLALVCISLFVAAFLTLEFVNSSRKTLPSQTAERPV